MGQNPAKSRESVSSNLTGAANSSLKKLATTVAATKEKQMIVGQMDPEQFAKVKAKKDEEKKRTEERKRARDAQDEERKRFLEAQEAERKRAAEIQHELDAAAQPLKSSALKEQMNRFVTELMARRHELTKKGLTRRQPNGRYIKRTEQMEAIAEVVQLEKLGV